MPLELLQDSDSSQAIAPHWSSSYPEYLSPDQDKREQRRVVWARLQSHRSNLANRLSEQKNQYLALCQELNPRTTQVESSHKPLFHDILPRVKDNRLLVWQMNLKVNHSRFVLLHVIEIQLPMSLRAADVPCIQVLLNLIPACAKLHSGAVMALVHILVDVLDCLDRGNGLHIDVAVIFPDEIPGVTDNPLIVNLIPSSPSNTMCLPSVMTSGASIRVLSDSGLLSGGLWKALGTYPIHHARRVWILNSTGEP